MLYMFDIDGTLIRSFLREGGAPCPTCGGGGTLENEHDSTDDRIYTCWRCNGSKKVKDSSAFDLVEVLPGRREKLSELADDSARFALVTNQGGVAFGYQTVEQVFRKLGAIVAAFQGFYLRSVSIHYCFTHPKATVEGYKVDSSRRKPGPGMLLEALEAHDVNGLFASVFVGDMDTDRQAAEAAGVAYEDAEGFFGG